MHMRRALGLDLKGWLARNKKRYRYNIDYFDYREVWCDEYGFHMEEQLDGTYKPVYMPAYGVAYAYINPRVSPDFSRLLRFETPRYSSVIIATAVMEIEVMRASAAHPDTKFYFRKRDSNVLENAVGRAEVCASGVWTKCEYDDLIPRTEKCMNCGLRIPNIPVCKNCGKFHSANR